MIVIPKEKKENLAINGVLKESYHILKEKDERKLKSVQKAGFHVLVIWNDEDVNSNIKKCLQFVKERMSNVK